MSLPKRDREPEEPQSAVPGVSAIAEAAPEQAGLVLRAAFIRFLLDEGIVPEHSPNERPSAVATFDFPLSPSTEPPRTWNRYRPRLVLSLLLWIRPVAVLLSRKAPLTAEPGSS